MTFLTIVKLLANIPTAKQAGVLSIVLQLFIHLIFASSFCWLLVMSRRKCVASTGRQQSSTFLKPASGNSDERCRWRRPRRQRHRCHILFRKSTAFWEANHFQCALAFYRFNVLTDCYQYLFGKQERYECWYKMYFLHFNHKITNCWKMKRRTQRTEPNTLCNDNNVKRKKKSIE